MAAYRQVYDSRRLQADCQEPGSAPEPYARQSSMEYLYLTNKMLQDVNSAFLPNQSGLNFCPAAYMAAAQQT